jgi:hypothetical protein
MKADDTPLIGIKLQVVPLGFVVTKIANGVRDRLNRQQGFDLWKYDVFETRFFRISWLLRHSATFLNLPGLR